MGTGSVQMLSALSPRLLRYVTANLEEDKQDGLRGICWAAELPYLAGVGVVLSDRDDHDVSFIFVLLWGRRKSAVPTRY